jgi:aarF domain-containing kinase
MVITSQSLSPLPPLHTIPGSDPEWEAREYKFHAENIKQINNLLDKMNMQAPAVARRPAILLEHELARIRGDVVKASAWADIKRRASERQRPTSSAPDLSGTGESAWNEKNLDIFAALRRVIRTIFGKET